MANIVTALKLLFDRPNEPMVSPKGDNQVVFQLTEQHLVSNLTYISVIHQFHKECQRNRKKTAWQLLVDLEIDYSMCNAMFQYTLRLFRHLIQIKNIVYAQINYFICFSYTSIDLGLSQCFVS